MTISSDNQTPTLYDRLGGKDAIKAAVDIFYDEKVLKDDELLPFFEGINMAKQKAMQIQFLSSALGGPIKYMGKDMYTAHKHLIEERGLKEHHFDLVAGHLVATLKQLGVGQDMVDEVVALLGPIKPAMFGPKEDQAQASLYDRLGGKDAIKAAVDIFYDEKVLKDSELLPFFEGINMAKQKAMQIQFLSSALGGPIKYMGKDMYTAHKHLIEERGLNEHHFDLVAGHLVATLKQLGVGQGMVDEVVALLGPIKPAMFGDQQEKKQEVFKAPQPPASLLSYVSESINASTSNQFLFATVVAGTVAAALMWLAPARR